jgi:hypothetical protein
VLVVFPRRYCSPTTHTKWHNNAPDSGPISEVAKEEAQRKAGATRCAAWAGREVGLPRSQIPGQELGCSGAYIFPTRGGCALGSAFSEVTRWGSERPHGLNLLGEPECRSHPLVFFYKLALALQCVPEGGAGLLQSNTVGGRFELAVTIHGSCASAGSCLMPCCGWCAQAKVRWSGPSSASPPTRPTRASAP